MTSAKPGAPRKRSRRVALVAMGMSVSALALTGCEEQVDAFQFASVDGCVTSGAFSEAECRERFEVAKTEHERAAPRYQSRADCEAEHGVEACTPREGAPSTGGLWMPLMIGWMMGNALSGPVATQPLYRSSQPGMARTAAGANVDAKAGKVSVPKTTAAKPPAGKVVARGGFGRTGGAYGTRSFGG